jgi:hypothetical protein
MVSIPASPVALMLASLGTTRQEDTLSDMCPGACACSLARLHQALTVDELLARVANLEADLAACRVTLREALHVLHDGIANRDRFHRDCWRTRQQLRRLVGVTREQTAARTRRRAR